MTYSEAEAILAAMPASRKKTAMGLAVSAAKAGRDAWALRFVALAQNEHLKEQQHENE